MQKSEEESVGDEDTWHVLFSHNSAAAATIMLPHHPLRTLTTSR